MVSLAAVLALLLGLVAMSLWRLLRLLCIKFSGRTNLLAILFTVITQG
jgi:hypothetical protein